MNLLNGLYSVIGYILFLIVYTLICKSKINKFFEVLVNVKDDEVN